MAQKLIVEGDNDIHVITHFCLQKGVKNIVGYEDETEYKLQFVYNAGGKGKAKKGLRIILEQENKDLKNIGIVIDADSQTENSCIDTWLSIRNILSEFGYANLPNNPQIGGTIINQEGKSKIGIWIMPDNQNGGYLEHFYEQLLVDNDEFWIEANDQIESFITGNRNRFPLKDKQKAKVHTWLSWQQKPEAAMGQSIKDYQGLFDLNNEISQSFFNWFINTFDVNMKEQ
jgi:hypothetical protein